MNFLLLGNFEDSSMCKHFQLSSTRFSQKRYKKAVYLCRLRCVQRWCLLKILSPNPNVWEFAVCVDHNSSYKKCMPEAWIHTYPNISHRSRECASLTISWNRNPTKFQSNYELIKMYKKFSCCFVILLCHKVLKFPNYWVDQTLIRKRCRFFFHTCRFAMWSVKWIFI